MERVDTVIVGKCIIVYRAGCLYHRFHVVCVITHVKRLHLLEVEMSLKVEEGLEAEVGEDPEPISFPEIKAESEVSYVSVFSLLHISHLLYACMSVAILTSLYA